MRANNNSVVPGERLGRETRDRSPRIADGPGYLRSESRIYPTCALENGSRVNPTSANSGTTKMLRAYLCPTLALLFLAALVLA